VISANKRQQVIDRVYHEAGTSLADYRTGESNHARTLSRSTEAARHVTRHADEDRGEERRNERRMERSRRQENEHPAARAH
jgi:hypothetical protein